MNNFVKRLQNFLFKSRQSEKEYIPEKEYIAKKSFSVKQKFVPYSERGKPGRYGNPNLRFPLNWEDLTEKECKMMKSKMGWMANEPKTTFDVCRGCTGKCCSNCKDTGLIPGLCLYSWSASSGIPESESLAELKSNIDNNTIFPR